MTQPATPRDKASTWDLQWPGRRNARNIPDAIVEPDWSGLRVLAALTEDSVALFVHHEEIPVPDEVVESLQRAFTAFEAVVEGQLTPRALRTGEGTIPRMPKIERPSLLIPRGMMQRAEEDQRLARHDHARAAYNAEIEVLEAMAAGQRHAFVATDLLWLDGEPLLEIPLQERKRLLGSVLAESTLVRVTAFVRASAGQTLMTWAALGFENLSYRAANSHYLPGEENPDWAISRAPRGRFVAAAVTPVPDQRG
jgi:hypothetical protein